MSTLITKGYFIQFTQYQYLFMEGQFLIFNITFPIFDLVHMQFIWTFGCGWPAVLMNSFYPVTNITDQENSCYPNSSLPGNLWHGSIISLHMHHAFLNVTQNIWVFSTLTHRAGLVGNFFSQDSIKVCSPRYLTELFTLWRTIYQQLLQHFLCVVFYSRTSTFSLILKGFNIGQEKVEVVKEYDNKSA